MIGQFFEAAYGATDVVGDSAHERDGYIVFFGPFGVPDFSAHIRQIK